jgi:hypothetical protein
MSSGEPWLCARCAVEQPPGPMPERCAICSDERECVSPEGQQWSTLTGLREAGQRGSIRELEPGLFGITVAPSVGLGQQAILVRTGSGNLLWDPTGYVDDDLVQAITAVGGVNAIAASHPHMFGVQVEWSRRFGDAPVYVNSADSHWLQRVDEVIRWWEDTAVPVPDVVLHRIGGHFPGSAVAHWAGADGAGVLLSGDTVSGTPDQRWVSFMRSYPNMIPLSALVVEVIASRLARLTYERLYDNFDGRVGSRADTWVQRSSRRYISWVRGDFDHLTGTLHTNSDRGVG